MTDATIPCPNCGTAIRLDETLAGPVLAERRRALDAEFLAKEGTLAEREAAARRMEIGAEAARADLAAQLAAERTRIAAEEAARARVAAGAETAALLARVTELTAKLTEAQAAQAETLRMRRELEDGKRELELTVLKRLAGEVAAVRDKARAEADEAIRLKLAEKDKTIADMKAQAEAAQRKAEQGSQQLQGEVLELSFEATLAARFPHDRIEPVAKGARGADVIHHVVTPQGADCGAILWELKRAQNWAPAWLPKLRDDQRAAGTTIAVLLSDALPPGCTSFDLVEGVWIAHTRYALPLAGMLRQGLIDLQSLRIAQEGQATKTEMVYAYLTGPRFRQRIEAVIERFSEMQDDLNRERKAMQRLWSRREQQINAVVGATVGLYGDLQGIAGSAVPDLPALDLAPIGQDDDGEPPALA
ncbi:MAG: DUF2130 domain-containing protein [Paracoccaceae bacterium]